MKKNSKIVAVAVSLMLVVLVLAGCGGGGSAPEELAGKWTLSGADVMGQTVSIEDIAATGVDVDMSFDFKSEKKVEVSGTTGGTTATDTVDYTYENGAITITQQGTTITLELVEGTLQYDVGGAKLLFKR